MPVVVKNVGPIELGPQNQKNTSIVKSTSDQGTVRVFYENREYVFGPNDAKTLENGIGANLVAQDSRLRIMDSRDGAFSTGRS
jgi:hypothetical protein